MTLKRNYSSVLFLSTLEFFFPVRRHRGKKSPQSKYGGSTAPPPSLRELNGVRKYHDGGAVNGRVDHDVSHFRLLLRN